LGDFLGKAHLLIATGANRQNQQTGPLRPGCHTRQARARSGDMQPMPSFGKKYNRQAAEAATKVSFSRNQPPARREVSAA